MVQGQANLTTAALDIGGTGIKGMLLDSAGKPISEREREATPNPATPEAMLRVMDEVVNRLGKFDRVSVGFPGVVKRGATQRRTISTQSGLAMICKRFSPDVGRSPCG